MSDILDEPFDGTKQSQKFEFFRDFFNEEQAAAFAKLLQKQQIDFKIEPVKTLMGDTITGGGMMPHAILKLQPSDFSRVNEILAKSALNDEDFVANHYFQGYEHSELLEVVQKPDEWNAEDVAVAKQLLDEKGFSVPQEKLQSFETERRKVLEAGKPFNVATGLFYVSIIVLISVFISLWFWIGGIGLGWYYWMDKSTYVDGKRYFTFNVGGRNIGMIIFLLSCFFMVLSLILPFGFVDIF